MSIFMREMVKICQTKIYTHCYTDVADVCLNDKKRNNNIQERFNSTVRSFLRQMRGVKKKDTALIRGFITYYNFMRPHSSLKDRTPARMAGIVINGTNEWDTLIANEAWASWAERRRS